MIVNEEEVAVLQETVVHWYDEERALGRREGISEGMEKGINEGIRKGMIKGEESVLRSMRDTIMQMIASRFGEFPGAWGGPLEAVTDPVAIATLLAGIYQVASPGEYEALLRNAAGAGK